MTDDHIRELLAGITPQSFWAPKGHTAILVDKVIEAGGAPAAVQQWVEAHGGWLDRTLPAVHRSVLSRGPAPAVQHFFAVPEEALRPGVRAA